MVTVNQYGNTISTRVLLLDGLSTDTKPVDMIDNARIGNGSVFYEMDTKKCFKFDEENKAWDPM